MEMVIGNGTMLRLGGRMPTMMVYMERQRPKLFGELVITNGMTGAKEMNWLELYAKVGKVKLENTSIRLL